ncbi:hypothetical protein BJ166DRAFT_360721 [Pestalotiopsis sp. NC0098]|nr:hypothetical protein BJ166DRAFT_360721 [Pestalotiopsis sp. NC0098]
MFSKSSRTSRSNRMLRWLLDCCLGHFRSADISSYDMSNPARYGYHHQYDMNSSASSTSSFKSSRYLRPRFKRWSDNSLTVITSCKNEHISMSGWSSFFVRRPRRNFLIRKPSCFKLERLRHRHHRRPTRCLTRVLAITAMTKEYYVRHSRRIFRFLQPYRGGRDELTMTLHHHVMSRDSTDHRNAILLILWSPRRKDGVFLIKLFNRHRLQFPA